MPLGGGGSETAGMEIVCSCIRRLCAVMFARCAWSTMYSLNEASASRSIAVGLITPAYHHARSAPSSSPIFALVSVLPTHLLPVLEPVPALETAYPPRPRHSPIPYAPHAPASQRGGPGPSRADGVGEGVAEAGDLADLAAVEDGEADGLVCARLVLVPVSGQGCVEGGNCCRSSSSGAGEAAREAEGAGEGHLVGLGRSRGGEA